MNAVPHQPSFGAHPLVTLSAAFALGVVLARFANPPLAASLAIAGAFTTAGFYALAKGRHAAASLLIVFAFACAGLVLALVSERSSGELSLRRFYEQGRIASGDPLELTGVLERAPEVTPDGLQLSLRVEGLRHKSEGREASGRVELFAPVRDGRTRALYESLELRRGARLRVMVSLSRAERFRNPGVTPLGEYLDARDVDARGTIKSPLLVERLDDEKVFVPLVLLETWRAALIERVDEIFSPDAAGVLKAAVLGNRSGLSRATAERFREGGTFHVLVISGLHITFVGGLAYALARRLTRRRVWRWASAVACVWAYAAAVGAEPSVVRAALMFTAAALAPALGRRSDALNVMGGAALALLVWRPRNLLDPSFQLTFLSVTAIVALSLPLISNLKSVGEWRPRRATPYPPACPRRLLAFAEALFWGEKGWRREMGRATHSYRLFKSPWAARLERLRVQRPLRYAFAAALVSLSVQVVLLPLLVVYFHRLSFASIVLNVFVGALMVALAACGLAALLLSQLSADLAAPLVRLAETICRLMVHSVDPLADVNLASIRLPEYSGAASVIYLIYFVPLFVLTRALLRWRPLGGPPTVSASGENTNRSRSLRLAALAFVITLFIIVAHPLSAGRPDGRLRVDFLDVGQGDAALLTMPDGTTLLVDAGGRPRFGARGVGEDDGTPFERDARGVGEAVVSEYLWWRGLDHVNYVLATHADADHIDGLNDVAKNFRADAAFLARSPAEDAEFARFAATTAKRRVPVYLIGRGDRLSFGAVTVDVLWPPRAEAGAASSNDDSVVLRVRYGRRVFLLTGDIEGRAEAALAAAGQELRCDAIKVPHHGSRTSSTEVFVNAASPSLAVVSVGLASPYGHPHPSVVERWRSRGAEVLTTGEHGTITLTTDGEDLLVETFVEK